jgi:hypothetical protein
LQFKIRSQFGNNNFSIFFFAMAPAKRKNPCLNFGLRKFQSNLPHVKNKRLKIIQNIVKNSFKDSVEVQISNDEVNNKIEESSVQSAIISENNQNRVQKPKDNVPSIENVSIEETLNNDYLIGRRIVDLPYFLENLKKIGNHFSGMQCTFEYLEA